MLAVFLLRLGNLPPQIPLFYSRPWGEEQLADSWMVFILPIILNLLFFLNKFIYNKFFFGNEFVKKIIDYLDIFLIIAITFIFIKIMLLIT